MLRLRNLRRSAWLIAVACAVAAVKPVAAQEPVFDLHVHVWNGEESLRAYEQQLRASRLEIAGIGAMWFGGPNQALSGRPDQVRQGNDGVLALAARHSRVIPVGTVHPYDGALAIAELERIAEKGIKMIKLHPHTQRFDPADPRVLTLVRRAGELGIITAIDNASILPGDNEKLFNLALSAPNTRFIFTHLGGLSFRFWNVLKLARTAEGLFGNNIYFDISATVALIADSPIEEEFVWTMRNVGIDHILLGSDYPQYSLEQTVLALDRLPLDASEKAMIRAGNARALLGRQ